MASPTAALRPRGGLLIAAVALVVAVGLAFAVTAFTSDRTKHPGHTASGAPAGGTHGGGSAPAGAPASATATTAPAIPKAKVVAQGVVKGVQSWKQPVRIQVSHGTLLAVKTTDDTGVVLDGTLGAAGWVSTGVVVPDRTYQVQTYVRGLDGTAAYHTLNIKTSLAQDTVGTSVTLQTGASVGVGFPLVVKFTQPVTDRYAVQQALQVTTSVPVVGAWHWFSSTEVHYRPETYWPAHTQITLHDHLTSVEAAPGVWGDSDRDISFSVGDSHVSTVDVTTQRMTVRVNGAVVSTYKVSTGRPAFPTKGGVHIVLSKTPTTVMDSTKLGYPQLIAGPGGKLVKDPNWYHETVLWDTRISDGGAFVHYAPWSIPHQGIQPVSHGCVNADKADAIAFFKLSVPGDVVNIIHAVVPPKLDDPGMMDWNYTWAQWIAGSATAS